MGRGVVGRWPRAADAAVPGLILVAHVVPSAGRPASGGLPPVPGVTAVLVAVLVLAFRRRHPGWTLAGVLATCAVAAAALPGPLPDPGLVLAGWVALFSLAVHRTGRVALAGAAATTVVLATAVSVTAARPPSPATVLDEGAATAVVSLVVVLFGQLRRALVARRRRLAARVDGLARERAAVAAAERERLTRELHDAAGHHLSAVVVQSTAALRLGHARPELSAVALAGAARSGREVLAAVRGLVTPAAPASGGDGLQVAEDVLRPLCDEFGRFCDEFGRPVVLRVRGERRPLPAGLVTAAHRIVQEALTNAMRYAPGAPVTVDVEYRPRELGVIVANARPWVAGGSSPGGGSALGGGRGVAGMRARAAELGGELAAGPDGRGGWSVRAVLPSGSPARGARRRAPADGAVVLCCAIPPSAVAVLLPGPAAPGPGATTALVLLSFAHALPLLWRRSAAAAALAGTLAVALAWALATAAGLLDLSWLAVIAAGGVAELAGIYSVGAHGRTGRSWFAPVGVGAVSGAVAGLAAVADPAERAGPATVGLAVLWGVVLAVWLVPVWALGVLVRVRRGRYSRRQQALLVAHAARVGEAALAERRRVAAGLGPAVQDRTLRLVRLAESHTATPASSGDGATVALTAIQADAREALAGLRRLLDGLDRAEVPA
jgi:signal transduction histidine kinase